VIVVIKRFSKHLLKAGIVEPQGRTIAEQRLVNPFPLQRIATNEWLLGNKALSAVSAATDNRE
jgi:hypothetical protein